MVVVLTVPHIAPSFIPDHADHVESSGFDIHGQRCAASLICLLMKDKLLSVWQLLNDDDADA